MDSDKLRRIADQLEHAIEGEPQTRLTQGKPWPWLSLNRAGCLALAVNLLRLAAKPDPFDGSDITQDLVGIDQINEEQTDMEIFLLRRTDTVHRELLDESSTSPAINDRFALLGCSTVALLLAAIFLSGIWFWVQLIFTGT